MSRLANDTQVYGSSLRAAPVPLTLERAQRLGSALGISRVTEITRLDRIGIPVCASIRPGAMPGSLCVNAGKGVTSEEARASAWMEAIEYALAEPGASSVEIIPSTARQVLDGKVRPDAIYDFCPHMCAPILLDAPMPCVRAEELLSGSPCLVPAELVFLPGGPFAPPQCFGSSSNGLASGNSLLEATVHGLAETIETDIQSFHLLHDTSLLVNLDSLPPLSRALADRILAAGLTLFVRFMENPFGLPCFTAAIVDPDADSPMLINCGYGCHPHRQIALARALCEAAQSRLSVIHGGRDDLAETSARFLKGQEGQEGQKKQEGDAEKQANDLQRLRRRWSADDRVTDYASVVDCSASALDLSAAFEVMVKGLARNGLRKICRVVFTPPESELQVVKIIVPQLEECEVHNPRVGRRLRDYCREHLREIRERPV